MLDASHSLYIELNEDLIHIPVNRQDNIKAILCEYVSIKCAEEIKKELNKMIYLYLSKDRDLANNILTTDNHIMPRDFKKLEKNFNNASFNLTGLEDLKLLMVSRHGSAHNYTTSTHFSWEQLKGLIENSSLFLLNFDSHIKEGS